MMVNTGHAEGAPIADLGFRNPSAPGLSIETFSLAELRQRVPLETLRRPARLEFHQLILISSGRGAQRVDFVEHPCEPGTLLWTRPGQVQENTAAVLEGRLVLFTEAFLPRSPGLRVILDAYDTSRWQLKPELLDPVDRSMCQLAEDYAAACGMAASPAASPPLGLELLRHQLTVLLLRIAALPGPEPTAETITAGSEIYVRFRRRLEDDFASTRRVENYATALGYSTKTINRVCQDATGHSAKFIIDRRVILEAKRLLIHTSLPVSTIACRLNFDQATNFGKYFSRHTGLTPGQFRLNSSG
ncbi:AraC family transcriptional regulator [Actinomadura physcomitrii]|nr:helix-turn-helix domain-containing protein [Actinomadura physcomitrii]